MTIQHEVETFSFVFIASVMATIVIGVVHKPFYQNFHATTPFASMFSTTEPTPTPEPEVNLVSQTSSDGKEKLTMKEVNTSGMKTYTFTLTDGEKNTTTSLFSTSVATSSSMTVPFNTFSPDNSYVFLERKDGTIKHYLVFQTSTNVFADGKEYIDVTDTFGAYTSNYIHPEVTGWGDNNLLIINTTSTEGQHASFWMELPSKNFIQLSSYFP